MNQLPKNKPKTNGWSRGDKIAFWGVVLTALLTALAGIISIVNPEIRKLVGLGSGDKPTSPVVSSPPTRPVIPVPRPTPGDGMQSHGHGGADHSGPGDSDPIEKKPPVIIETVAQIRFRKETEKIQNACSKLNHQGFADLFIAEYKHPDHLELHFKIEPSPEGKVRFSCKPTADCLIQIYTIKHDASTPAAELSDAVTHSTAPLLLPKEAVWECERTPATGTVDYVILGWKKTHRKGDDEDLIDLLLRYYGQDVSGWTIDTKPLPTKGA